MNKYLKHLRYIDYQNIVLCALSVAVLAYYFSLKWMWGLLFIPVYTGLVTRLSYLAAELKQTYKQDV